MPNQPSESDFAALEAHHSDNQRRFMKIEEKLDANTTLTQKLASDTSDLLEMWKDAGVFFKWMRRAGSALMWIGKVATGVAGIWALWKFGGPK
jgi:hypothetical protein